MAYLKRDISSSANRGAEHILKYCANANARDRVLVIFDQETISVAKLLFDCASTISDHVLFKEIPLMINHGQEPPLSVAKEMMKSTLILAVTKFSLAHTKARLDAQSFGARYLSLPDYSFELLASPSIFGVDVIEIPQMERLTAIMSVGSLLSVTSSAGTNLDIDISGRLANNCPGIVSNSGDLGSPPDMEVNICPVESRSNGFIVVDGSVTHDRIGVLRESVSLEIEAGQITRILGPQDVVDELNFIFESPNSEKAYTLAELGVGFNKKAELCGQMLIDEGASDCLHFGFGSNHTVGGLNEVPFHVDFVMRRGSILIDNITVIEHGKVLV